ncbi:MAG: segregation/condensation protein A [Bacteroidia bacterium]|nr:segregation/condensation protein A [Bacteroidia bacterium]
MEKAFEIKLPEFEGPFDLLLFFIERDELDIYNIPIAKITSDFLAYIRQMHQLNMEVASEFILVAATLMRIKAKMLLPRPEMDELGNEIDPRKSLIDQILIYKQFKNASEEMKHLEETRSLKEVRGNISNELMRIAQSTTYADELSNLSMFHLMNAFEKVMRRFEQEQKRVRHKVEQYPYTIEQQRSFVTNFISLKGRIPFTDMLMTCKNKVEVIFTFLAILELLQEQILRVTLGDGFNNFWLEQKEI